MILAFFATLAVFASAATLPYQGLATQLNGSPKADDTVSAVFKLYSVPIGGTALWTETQASVATKRGLFSVTLGSVADIPASLFNGTPLYLGVSLDGATEASPRLQLGSVPYAIGARHSDTVRAVRWADRVQFAQDFKDSAASVRQALNDSMGVQRSRLSDTTDSLRSKLALDRMELARLALGGLGNLHDTADTLRKSIAALKGAIDSQSSVTASQQQLLAALQVLNQFPPATYGAPWQKEIAYGLVVDARDGQAYRTVTIGNQIWMAQNLNFRNAQGGTDTMGVCPGANAQGAGGTLDSCQKYGRLYLWSQALGLNDSCNTKSCANQIAVNRQGICPSGWHVPTYAEWHTLITAQMDSLTSGTKLKALDVWNAKAGNDDFGFRALAAGYYSLGTQQFTNVGMAGNWWTATEASNPANAMRRLMNSTYTYTNGLSNPKSFGYSLRCVKNSVP